jgi:hypothetical protein
MQPDTWSRNNMPSARTRRKTVIALLTLAALAALANALNSAAMQEAEAATRKPRQTAVGPADLPERAGKFDLLFSAHDLALP